MPPAEKEFVLTHVIKNVSSMKEDEINFTNTKEHFGVPWKISYTRRNGFLTLFLYCSNNTTGEWSIETRFSLKLSAANGRIEQSDATKTFASKGKEYITVVDNWGWSQYIEWDDLEKDFLIDDKVTIEAHVKILKMTGIEKKKLRNFDESRKELSDIVLIVKDEKFYVLKLFLACQSSYFNALFIRGFQESEQSEITLSDVDPKDFQNFLEVLHGEMAIDDSTITGILQLADMYHTQTVLQHCEVFLMEKSEKKLKEKLEISARFNLKKSKSKCLLEIKTVEDVKSVVAGDLSEMDRSVQTALLQKLLSLC